MPSKWTAERRREIEIQCDAVTGRERAALKDCLAEIDRLTALLGETQTGLSLTGETQTAAVIAAQENRE